ncbi:MAG TPA: acyltransferase [Pseudomonas sp.]|uniref:acyltransferase n=1 Tax=Pseudomonas sp. TaxID=306 RepID=UPI002B4A5CB3|nr:acyltransferase [Pseudomonas sp.]HKS11864.1 acyltransferase [Pseudomonas sp.]
MAFLSQEQLDAMGFARVGKHVLVSDKCSFYNCAAISIGNHVRIDDFCVLSAGDGGIEIGDHVHIAVYSSLMGGGRITLGDFSGLSSRVSVYSSSDDYSGASMTNPTVPDDFKHVQTAPVDIGRHVIIGAGSVVLPGVTLGQGAAIGALSLVTKRCDEFGIYSGVPARRIKARKRALLELEQRLRAESGGADA